MSQELPDDDPQKWVYSAHAGAKHAIQRRYLGAWLPILGRHNPKLILFDGFAGRGRYTTGQDGSPLLFWHKAIEAVDNGRAESVEIRCVELHPNNYANLCDVIAALKHPGVSIAATCGKFAENADALGATLSKQRKPPPTFWTADPFGFKGVPLDTIRRLMKIERSEVLITFMVRDMRRFLEQKNFEAPLTEFFGGDAWRDCIGDSPVSTEERLLLKYSEIVRRDVASFATPFRVFEDDRRQTLYYLVHLTNSPLGMREMKKAMIHESPDMTFWPVTVRDPNQLAMDTQEHKPYPSLQIHLVDTYAGQTMTFEALLNQDYPYGLWLEPAYRDALLDLERSDRARISRDRTTPTGRAPRGLQLEDTVEIPLQLFG